MNYYADIYRERWPALASALVQPASRIGLRCLEGGGYILDADVEEESPPSEKGSGNGGGNAPALPPAYRLDRISVLAAESLELPQKGRVLDACAAPGGKSLVIASRISGETALVANELSPERRRRLKLVLSGQLSRSRMDRVSVTGFDAASLCRRLPSSFDAILLDVPCSSERHLLGDPARMEEWSPARTRNLACRQWALLSSAFLMLAPGGCLVYSTCSISPGENDGVAGRLLKKYGEEFNFLPLDIPYGETSLYGRLFLPDACDGAGPMYISRILKRSLPSRS
jgi:16S rRNA (cytosine1407-C5)-methyltransferase